MGKLDKMKGDQPENQEDVKQNLVNYKTRLLKLHHDINANQIEFDRLRLQTKDVSDAITDLKTQEMDVMVNRRQLFLRLSNN